MVIRMHVLIKCCLQLYFIWFLVQHTITNNSSHQIKDRYNEIRSKIRKQLMREACQDNTTKNKMNNLVKFQTGNWQRTRYIGKRIWLLVSSSRTKRILRTQFNEKAWWIIQITEACFILRKLVRDPKENEKPWISARGIDSTAKTFVNLTTYCEKPGKISDY